jgi:hypothetical protein
MPTLIYKAKCHETLLFSETVEGSLDEKVHGHRMDTLQVSANERQGGRTIDLPGFMTSRS